MPEPLYEPRLRPERLIAGGRVVLAVASLFAVWLDVDEPVRFAPLAYGVLVGYVGYAVAVAALVWRQDTMSRRWPLLTHAADLICFSLFIFFTEGPGSPFTVYFVFALLSATLRWQARGTFWTALIVIAAFFSFGVYFAVVLDDPGFDLRALIIRGVYLIVLAGLLGYVGTQDQRTLREMWRLAAWPQTLHHDAQSLANDLLAYAARLLEAPKAALVWVEVDTPWRQSALWEKGTWTYGREPADRPLVAEALRHRAFTHDSRSHRTLVQDRDGPHVAAWRGDALDPQLALRFASSSMISVPVGGASFDGRLFVMDKRNATADDLVLTEVVAGMIAARLDAFYLAEQLRQAAATEERLRLARDLHDGVLQSFTGIALRLAAIRRMVDGDRAAAAAALEDAQRVLASEQRDLRFFIQELKALAAAPEGMALGMRLDELAQRMEREWDLRVDLRLDGVNGHRLTPALSRDVYHIIREALVNAARHGAATVAQVSIEPGDGDAIAVSIADNGRGFPFSGRYSADDLASRNLGPKSLRERVRALNGSLVLESGPTGAELRVELPYGEAA